MRVPQLETLHQERVTMSNFEMQRRSYMCHIFFVLNLRWWKMRFVITIHVHGLRFDSLKTREAQSPHVRYTVTLANNSDGTTFALYRDDEGRHGEMEGKIILGKEGIGTRGRVGGRAARTSRVVIREEPSHRSPGHLTGYRLPKEKRSDREKWTRRAEGFVRSVGVWAPDILPARTTRHSSSSFWKRSSKEPGIFWCTHTCENISRLSALFSSSLSFISILRARAQKTRTIIQLEIFSRATPGNAKIVSNLFETNSPN